MLDRVLTPQLSKLHQAFADAGFDIRVVGGAVRDLILGETPKDIDLATDATPEEMKVVGKTAGFTVVATGEQHGTMTLVVDHEPFEVTTLRIDTDTDGRHATVEFTRSFEKDAERRDLTFNAMSLDFNGQLYDYFGGQDDLASRTVRFVGNARQRVEEDFLRILRFFRFAARFEANMDTETLKMFSDPAVLKGLQGISVERFWLEMSKLLMAPGRVAAFEAMQYCGVAEALGFPDMLAQELRHADDAPTAVAAFFAGDEAGARAFCQSWNMSSDETNKAAFVAGCMMRQVAHSSVEDMLVNNVPRDWVVSAMLSNYNPVLAEYARTYDPPVFPVKGQDLMDAGMKAGPDMGRRLKDLRARWFASRFVATKEELMSEVE